MSNNTPEAMTKQQRQCEKKQKQSAEKKIFGIINIIKKDCKNWVVIYTKEYLKKANLRKENKQKIDTRICLKKQTKSKKTQEE